MKKKGKKKIIIGIIVVLVIAFILINISGNKSEGVSVSTKKAYRGDVEYSITTTGTVKSEESKVYFAVANAKVEKVNVQVGDIVRDGDVLIKYNEENILSSISKNDLELIVADANYKSTINDNSENQALYKTSSDKIVALEGQIEEKERYIKGLRDGIESERNARIEEIARDIETQNLYIISVKEEMNKAGRELTNDDINYYNKLIDGANAQLLQLSTEQKLLENFKASDNKDELLEIANKDLSKLKEELSVAKADQNKADAALINSYKVNALKTNNDLKIMELYEANEKLQNARKGVIDDFAGIVTDINVTDGAPVSEGSKLLTIESIDKVMVTFGASKYDLESLEVGQKVDILIAGASYNGHISKIDHIATGTNANGSATVNVRVHIDNPDDNIYLGIDGRLTIYISESKDTLLVPVEAVNTDRNGDFVYVIKNGKAVRKNVTVGISSNSEIEIISGIDENDEVVTLVTGDIHDGTRVKTNN